LALFLKYQQIILRAGGGFMLLIAFVIHFWYIPQTGVSQNDLAAARVARMEASVLISKSTKSNKRQSDTSKYTEALKDTQKKQMEYLTVIVMIFGFLALGYSFVPRGKRDEENS